MLGQDEKTWYAMTTRKVYAGSDGLDNQENCMLGEKTKRYVWGPNDRERCLWVRTSKRGVCGTI